jgi:hypothetical protein
MIAIPNFMLIMKLENENNYINMHIFLRGRLVEIENDTYSTSI